MGKFKELSKKMEHEKSKFTSPEVIQEGVTVGGVSHVVGYCLGRKPAPRSNVRYTDQDKAIAALGASEHLKNTSGAESTTSSQSTGWSQFQYHDGNLNVDHGA